MLLEGFRSHKRWLMVISMVFVIPSFVVTGIYSYNRMMDDSNEIAEIADQPITLQQFDEQKRRTLESLRAQMGDEFRANILDTAAARVSLLENIMNERALGAEVLSDGVNIPESTAVGYIKQAEGFQQDGKFSAELYENYLRSVGYSDEYFVQLIRGDLARQMLQNGVSGSAVAPETVTRRLHRLLAEVRTASLLTVPAADYLRDVKVTSDQARGYWEKNPELFRVPDTMDVQYVVFTPALFENVKPSEEDVKTFYEQNSSRWSTPEQRRAAHILIDLSAGEEQAKKTAEDVAAQVRAKPADFGKLAKKYSKDPGSAGQNGDLGWFGKGVMVPEFEKAVFEGRKGEILGPVRSEFGWHIIRVEDVRAGSVKPLEEVRAEIEKLYREQKSAEMFGKEAEVFSNLVYEQPDTLQDIAEKYGMELRTAKNVPAEGPSDPEVKKYLNGSVMQSLFSEESRAEGNNTQASEVSPNVLVSARVEKFHPSHVRAFEEVEKDVTEMLRNEEALKRASAAGEKILADLQAGKKVKGTFEIPSTFTRSVPGPHSEAVVNAVLNADSGKLPVYVGVAEPGAYVIARVEKSHYTEPDRDQLRTLERELQSIYARVDTVPYFSALRAKYNAVIRKAEYAPGAKDKEPAK